MRPLGRSLPRCRLIGPYTLALSGSIDVAFQRPPTIVQPSPSSGRPTTSYPKPVCKKSDHPTDRFRRPAQRLTKGSCKNALDRSPDQSGAFLRSERLPTAPPHLSVPRTPQRRPNAVSLRLRASVPTQTPKRTPRGQPSESQRLSGHNQTRSVPATLTGCSSSPAPAESPATATSTTRPTPPMHPSGSATAATPYPPRRQR